MIDRDILSGQITIDPATVESADRGDPVVATASAPFDDHRLMPQFFYGNEQLTAQVTMLKE